MRKRLDRAAHRIGRERRLLEYIRQHPGCTRLDVIQSERSMNTMTGYNVLKRLEIRGDIVDQTPEARTSALYVQ